MNHYNKSLYIYTCIRLPQIVNIENIFISISISISLQLNQFHTSSISSPLRPGINFTTDFIPRPADSWKSHRPR